jgi:AcrR family transcriptional regulator
MAEITNTGLRSSNPEAPHAQSMAITRQPATALGPRAQRTISRILDATRDVFLTYGYAGTTIDEIARVAQVSRASFYTYFPSKREVLVAVGASSANEAERMIEKLPSHLGSRKDLRAWVAEYFDLLDVHGSFAFAWTQAAHEDEEIRLAGMKRHLKDSKMLGTLLGSNSGRHAADPAALGVVAFSTLERSWDYGRLYSESIGREALIKYATNALWYLAR